MRGDQVQIRWGGRSRLASEGLSRRRRAQRELQARCLRLRRVDARRRLLRELGEARSHRGRQRRVCRQRRVGVRRVSVARIGVARQRRRCGRRRGEEPAEPLERETTSLLLEDRLQRRLLLLAPERGCLGHGRRRLGVLRSLARRAKLRAELIVLRAKREESAARIVRRRSVARGLLIGIVQASLQRGARSARLFEGRLQGVLRGGCGSSHLREPRVEARGRRLGDLEECRFGPHLRPHARGGSLVVERRRRRWLFDLASDFIIWW